MTALASLLTDEAAVEHPGPHEEEGQQKEHKVVVVSGTWRSNTSLNTEHEKHSHRYCVKLRRSGVNLNLSLFYV